jgi:hypothetical protein
MRHATVQWGTTSMRNVVGRSTQKIEFSGDGALGAEVLRYLQVGEDFAQVSGTAAALIGLVLLAAAGAKARDGASFEEALATLAPSLPGRYVRRSLVAFEALLGALLLSGRAPGLGGAVAVGTLLAFSAALVALQARGGPDCGCFGAAPGGSPGRGLARNAALTAAALLVAGAADGPDWQGDAARAAAQVALALAAVVLWRLGEAAVDLLTDPDRLGFRAR